MKTKHFVMLFVFLSLISFTAFGQASGGTTSEPGSVDDPLVTKSYLEQKLNDILSNKSQVDKSTSTETEVSSNNLTIVELKQNQTLYGGSGSEIIVRSGKVLAVSSDESGMADVTIGKDITAGMPVELNHLLIVPREGRGIKPDPKNKQDIFVMVRGSYSIVDADGKKVTP
ncbi:hypothetical protein SAMN02799630_05241 [Paenibacillus sp. UNCCL117]|uniref:hypothetical protein n=1 Tax=unclassified Paenibacillus TaxID=185978 RepID=UPI000889F675|nr:MULTISPECIES: hypothetical protein [unclassified Paenibacillus]SDE34884.1 hypothetical protein SAMN04488602_12587 [Paenibacillus sp. cl123]SFW64374.1 hypothetical protein SAMN02799630_05241 [Paenibacillus sp. UNCCL117]